MCDVAALYVQKAGVYSRLSGVDSYDQRRDARTYAGPWPVVAHPPCRLWGKFKAWVKDPRQEERDLAFHALAMVEKYGGVLEHPVGSTFFREAGIPRERLWRVNQCDYGHRAEKATWLYLVGCEPPLVLPRPGVVITTVERMCRQERERTPLPFAQLLVQLARSCSPSS